MVNDIFTTLFLHAVYDWCLTVWIRRSYEVVLLWKSFLQAWHLQGIMLTKIVVLPQQALILSSGSDSRTLYYTQNNTGKEWSAYPIIKSIDMIRAFMPVILFSYYWEHEISHANIVCNGQFQIQKNQCQLIPTITSAGHWICLVKW